MLELSSCEAEYIAASTAACQAVWLRRLLAILAKREVQKLSLKIDNQAAISFCKNSVHHERSKHIDTRFHHIRECIEEGLIEVQHVNTKDQLADIFTKSLGRQKFIEMRRKVGVQEVKSSNKIKEVNVEVNHVVSLGLGKKAKPSPSSIRIPSPSLFP